MIERKLRRMAEEMQDFANLNGYHMVDMFTVGDDYVHVTVWNKAGDEEPYVCFSVKGWEQENARD